MITRNWASKFDFLNQNDHKIETCTIGYLAKQSECNPVSLVGYGQRLRTRQEHQSVIMAYLGFD